MALVDVLAGPARRRRDPRRAARRRGRADRGAAARRGPGRARERGPERPRHGARAGALRERASEHRALPGLRHGVRPAGGGGRQRRPVPRAVPRDRAARSWPEDDALRHQRRPRGAPRRARAGARAALPRALGGGLGGRARRGGRPGGQGALGARGAGCRRGGRAGRPRSRSSTRPSGALELVASPIWTRRGRRGPAAAAAAGPAHGRGAAGSWALAAKRSRPSPRTGRCCSAVSEARRRSTPADATPRRAR